jgi:hypothetical protein
MVGKDLEYSVPQHLKTTIWVLLPRTCPMYSLLIIGLEYANTCIHIVKYYIQPPLAPDLATYALMLI